MELDCDMMSHCHPPYPQSSEIDSVVACLKKSPPLVSTEEIDQLLSALEDCSNGCNFVIQAGDCAERFVDARPDITDKKYYALNEIKSALQRHFNHPITLIGRIAGQYGKPRTQLDQTFQAKKIYAYHGDLINGESPLERDPDPKRLLRAYEAAQTTYDGLASQSASLFTSHEAFSLYYETSLTREYQRKWFSTSAHFLWLGARNLDSDAHVHYLSQISNPIGIKVPAYVDTDRLIQIIKTINPGNKKGKVTLILRMGVRDVERSLPTIINAILDAELSVNWFSDPMHGNTRTDAFEKKYRIINDLVQETSLTRDLLHRYGTHLSGVHLETTFHHNVSECVTHECELCPDRAYMSALDPRLNPQQANLYVDRVFQHHKID